MPIQTHFGDKKASAGIAVTGINGLIGILEKQLRLTFPQVSKKILAGGEVSENKTGMRLLTLQKIFLRETDENHQLSIKELVERLKLEIPDCTGRCKSSKEV